MALKVVVGVTCPYCGHKDSVVATEDNTRRPIVILCDIENGPGCDRYYVARIKVVATATGQAIADE